ncbi:hypothetical protein, partial [Mycolicibacter senuensis]
APPPIIPKLEIPGLPGGPPILGPPRGGWGPGKGHGKGPGRGGRGGGGGIPIPIPIPGLHF